MVAPTIDEALLDTLAQVHHAMHLLLMPRIARVRAPERRGVGHGPGIHRGVTPGDTETRLADSFNTVDEVRQYAEDNWARAGYADITIEDQFGARVASVETSN